MAKKREPSSENKNIVVVEREDESIQRLSPRFQRLVHMHLSGCTVKQIAQAIQFTEQYVRNLLSREDIRAVIHKIQDAEDALITQNIKALRMKAIAKMNRLLDSKQDAIAYQAARDILDRTGYKGVEKKQVEVNVTFEQQLKEFLNDNNDIIEVESFDSE